MKLIKNTTLILALIVLFSYSCSEVSSKNKSKYNSVNGLVMTGYQGWFNTPGDGMDLGFKHYQKGKLFAPGSCTIDLWPDVSEYEKTYDTPFRHADGSVAKVFSSADYSTVDVHFKWMKEYGIDGAFVQRFVNSLKNEKSNINSHKVLDNCVRAAEKHGRAVCVMYDLSGMGSGDEQILIDDWKRLYTEGITKRKNNHYLYHNGKPLVVIWGVGFSNDRKYGLAEAEKIVDFLRNDPNFGGCSIMLGVPTHWRTLQKDAVSDPRLHDLLKRVDIIQPWLVGRFKENTYSNFQKGIAEDILWCQENNKDYLPTLSPGFSWYNLKSGTDQPHELGATPRNKGQFFWMQAEGAVRAGAKALYLAMFDEIDEGTAYFKCTNNPPVGESPFLTYEGLPSDHYLWLGGMSGKMLRGEIPLSATIPARK